MVFMDSATSGNHSSRSGTAKNGNESISDRTSASLSVSGSQSLPVPDLLSDGRCSAVVALLIRDRTSSRIVEDRRGCVSAM